MLRVQWARTQRAVPGAADSNYTISYVVGEVIVGPAPLAVAASSGSMSYGGTVPTISASYSGFVNGDSAASLVDGAHVLDHGHVVEPRR